MHSQIRHRQILPFAQGEMVEWSITAVLKTAVLRGTGGSNPSLSAKISVTSCKTTSYADFSFKGNVLNPMNRQSTRMHSGLDLKAKYEEVYSMLPGVVTVTSYSTNGGYYITVNHGACVCSYLHLSKILVRAEQRIRAGQVIAISGNTGRRTTGPHLHISCRWGNEKGKFFNPMLLLKFISEQLSNLN